MSSCYNRGVPWTHGFVSPVMNWNSPYCYLLQGPRWAQLKQCTRVTIEVPWICCPSHQLKTPLLLQRSLLQTDSQHLTEKHSLNHTPIVCLPLHTSKSRWAPLKQCPCVIIEVPWICCSYHQSPPPPPTILTPDIFSTYNKEKTL